MESRMVDGRQKNILWHYDMNKIAHELINTHREWRGVIPYTSQQSL